MLPKWWVVGTKLTRPGHPARIFTIERINFDDWSFHTSEQDKAKWFRWTLYEWTQFELSRPANQLLPTAYDRLRDGVDL